MMIAVGTVYATWALLTGPLAKWTKLGDRPVRRRKTTPTNLVPEDAAPTDEPRDAKDDPGT